jgi:[phosphatase 2A protein]-leucine-carboxy methyltransferase
LKDPYIHRLGLAPIRKQPMMNIGTYIRTTFIDQKMEEFIMKKHLIEKSIQVLSLGAGWDTRAHNLSDKLEETGCPHPLISYFEIDIKDTFYLKEKRLPSPKNVDLKLIVADLCDWPSCFEKLIAAGFQLSCPTFILCELVLVYLPVSNKKPLLESILESFKSMAPATTALEWLIVEPFINDDAFGEQMIQHFDASGLPTSVLRNYPTIQRQVHRFYCLGRLHILSMYDLYVKWLTSEQKSFIQSLEWLDELEEWHLLSKHYLFIQIYT